MPTMKRSRPTIQPEYGVPADEAGMLDWQFVDDEMRAARNYWVCTVRPDARPHAIPVWGIWLDGVFYHGGGDRTRRHRNLQRNPQVSVHLESGSRVVILEGTVEEVTDPVEVARVDTLYVAKYGVEHGTPMFALRPARVLAWTEYPTTVTRWTAE
ncbi:MAG: pyridoxamine 5'-phosphate oxidase family protein [Anaerolineae bacterium]